MFARKVEFAIEPGGQPVPMRWLDTFAMRSFTGSASFDDTLPVADGLLEVGLRVPLEELRAELEAWCRRKGGLAADATLRMVVRPLPEEARPPHPNP